MELKLNGAVQSVSSAVMLLEKSTVAALRTENEVRSSGARNPATVYALHFSAQNLQEQISRLRAELKVPRSATIPGVWCDLCSSTIQDEIDKVQSGVRLDMNLEKSRNKEEVSGWVPTWALDRHCDI